MYDLIEVHINVIKRKLLVWVSSIYLTPNKWKIIQNPTGKIEIHNQIPFQNFTSKNEFTDVS
jgi:hypothetical protein